MRNCIRDSENTDLPFYISFSGHLCRPFNHKILDVVKLRLRFCSIRSDKSDPNPSAKPGISAFTKPLILLFLFAAGFFPQHVQADESGHKKQTDGSPICIVTPDISGDKGGVQLIRSQDPRIESDSACKEQEEIDKNKMHEKGMDQQTEILEKLLMESLKTTTARPSP